MTDYVPLHEAHAHSTRCYWDLNQCRWVCQKPVGDGNRSIGDECAAQSPMARVTEVPPLSPMAAG